MKPFLIAGVPIAGIAGLALTATTTTNAWSPPSVVIPSTSRRGDSSTNSRSRRDGTRTSLPHSTTEETEVDVDTLGLTPQLRMMTDAFSSIPDERTRHKQLLYMASKLPNVDDAVRVPENKVPGCLSAVYVDCAATLQRAVETKDRRRQHRQWTVEYRGDSDGQLTKGLLALLIRGLNGHTPDEINAVNPAFVKHAKIAQSLTPGRNNGFLNMLGVMKRKAREAVEREMMMMGTKSSTTENDENEGEDDVTNNAKKAIGEEGGGGPMYAAILNTLITSLNPTSIELVDDSHKHAGHAGSKGWEDHGESHFSLLVVSDKFDGLNLVKRHKLIYGLLGDVMPKIHALAIIARTPSEEKKE